MEELNEFYLMDTTTNGIVRIRVNNSWAQYQVKIYSNGAWNTYQPYIYTNGSWQKYSG